MSNDLSVEVIEAMREYELLKIDMKQKEARIKDLQSIILPELGEDSQVHGEKGVFIISKKTKWIYSNMVSDMEDDLKEAKKEEQARGIAQEEFSNILVYRQNSSE